MLTLIQDIRYGLRLLRKNAGFTAIAVITLALGIGANAAVFSIVDGVLLKPLPYAQPDRLVVLQETFLEGYGPPSWPDFQDWRERLHTTSGLVGLSPSSSNLQGADQPVRVSSYKVTANMFEVLGVRPVLGRGFLPGEDASGAPCVTVLSQPLWREQFGADPGIVGRTVTMNGASCTVAGVTAPGFEFPPGFNRGLWTTLHPEGVLFKSRGSHFLQTVARLKPGVTLAQAQQEVNDLMHRISHDYPDADAERGGRALALQAATSDQVRSPLLILLAAVIAVLLIACVNVANMLLAQATARKREIAIRVALGATRWRLLRQTLTETLLIAAASAVIGVGFASAALSLLAGLMDLYLPYTNGASLDGRVLLFVIVVSALTAILCGVLPALQLGKDSGSSLRESGATTAGRGVHRLRGLLVCGQIALCLMLVTAAGLLTQTLINYQHERTGMAEDHVLTFKTAFSPAVYQGKNFLSVFCQPFLQHLRAVPGIKAAGMINLLPLESWGMNGSFTIVGHPAPKNPNDLSTEFRMVSPGYYASLGIVMLRGRDFSDSDRLGAEPVVIVNDTFGRKYFGQQNPVGQEIRLDDPGPVYKIVGVYRANRQQGVGAAPLPEMDMSYLQIDPKSEWYSFALAYPMAFVVRSAVAPRSLAGEVRMAMRETSPEQPIYDLRTMEEVRSNSLSGAQLASWLIGTFAGLAVVLALAGVNGVMSYAVAQRRKEIGLRMALGASPSDVLRMVLRFALALTLIGSACGVAGALATAGLLRSMLFGVSANNPFMILGAVAVLAAAGLLAAYLPARRAASIDPIKALRYD